MFSNKWEKKLYDAAAVLLTFLLFVLTGDLTGVNVKAAGVIPENAYLSPLAYWGLDESDLLDNEQNYKGRGFGYRSLELEKQEDTDFMLDYAACLMENFNFVMSDFAREEEDASYYLEYQFTYTGTANVNPVSSGCQLQLRLTDHNALDHTLLQWWWGAGLEEADSGDYAEEALVSYEEENTIEMPNEEKSYEELRAEMEKILLEMEQKRGETSQTAEQKTEGTPAVTADGPILPNFEAFTNGRASKEEVTEFSNYTKHVYFWNYNQKALNEYIALLQSDYGFTLRLEDVDENTGDFVFDYTGPGSVDTFEEDFNSIKYNDKCALVIWDLHYSTSGAELHIEFGDGLNYIDTGDRTTRELTPYNDGNGSDSGSSSASDCWYCGGDGVCPTCGGNGYVNNWVVGTREHLNQNCTDCYSPGKCRICGGSGHN